MYTPFDISFWNRKEAYYFFLSYEDPYVDASVEMDVTPLYDFCKSRQISFAYASLWVALKICNEIDNFRLRIVGEELRLYHTVHAGQTLGYDDGTYTNCFFKYDTDLVRFCRLCRAHADEIKAGPKMNERRTEELDMIHTSIIPWFSFINIKNPRKNKWDSIPKINFGKMSLSADGRRVMPLALSVHHALMDGYQMGLFFNRYQEIVNSIK